MRGLFKAYFIVFGEFIVPRNSHGIRGEYPVSVYLLPVSLSLQFIASEALSPNPLHSKLMNSPKSINWKQINEFDFLFVSIRGITKSSDTCLLKLTSSTVLFAPLSNLLSSQSTEMRPKYVYNANNLWIIIEKSDFPSNSNEIKINKKIMRNVKQASSGAYQKIKNNNNNKK